MATFLANLSTFVVCFLSILTTIGALSVVQLCELPATRGNVRCVSEQPRWTFNSEDEKCEVAGYYAGCGKTKNNFYSEQDCEEVCGDNYRNEAKKRAKTYPAACALPGGETGNCRALFYMFYYDNRTSTCKQYIYGGCGGNENMFDTLEECKRYCVGK